MRVEVEFHKNTSGFITSAAITPGSRYISSFRVKYRSVKKEKVEKLFIINWHDGLPGGAEKRYKYPTLGAVIKYCLNNPSNVRIEDGPGPVGLHLRRIEEYQYSYSRWLDMKYAIRLVYIISKFGGKNNKLPVPEKPNNIDDPVYRELFKFS